ncbi:FAD/NAD(P)-binding protein [Furfurilactobacillus curtus]|uniref:FAD-dependent oxidoreductase n=1 Tax=Furfurilactobacillus curtus TaxID=1746200 RepID=A0ABQ5JNS5_9LACO
MDIVLIGAGPRGLISAERLIEWQRQTNTYHQLNITLVDPFGVGGRVWQVGQPHELVMNTNPDFITLFTDETVKMDGPIAKGPNLFEWAHQQAPGFLFHHDLPNRAELLNEAAALIHNGYSSRSFFGAYQLWFYEYLQQRLTDNITLTILKEQAQSVRRIEATDRYLIKTGTHRFQADAVIMALGHFENDLTEEQVGLMNFADEHNLNYIAPTQPQEYQFDHVAADQTVILRGLGLSFFDAVTMLTQGRGGHFTQDEHQRLVYQPSGIEPHIIAGSRRGFPLRAKGRNEKGYGELDQPHFFTAPWFSHYQAGSLSGTRFIEQFHHEAEYVYYKRLLALKYPQVDAEEFLREFVAAPQPSAVVFRSPIIESDYLNWNQLLNPAEFLAHSDDSKIMADYLQADVEAALAGTKTGPLTSSLEMFRDLRDVVRRVVDNELIRAEDFRNLFLGQFDNENSYLSVGPPESRIAELQALVEAGVVTLLGPGMLVSGDENSQRFVTWSKNVPDQTYQADCLVEARLPAVSASHSQNPLIKQLIRAKLARPQQLTMEDGTIFETGAVDVDMHTNELLDQHGQAVTGLYFWGVPTEGKHWFTTASPRPGVNDSVLRTADATIADLFNRFADH